MEKILLKDLIKFNSEDLDNIKIKFNISDGDDEPIELFKRNPKIVNNQWLFWREKQKYFAVGQIAICLLRIDSDRWLLTTIKKITKDLDKTNTINYEGYELKEYEQYFGRIIIKYHKKDRNQALYYSGIYEELEVQQILPDIYDDDNFPGYDKVRLPYEKLKSILDRGKQDWISALGNQKAVYLITDKNTGKLYVGSATSHSGMLLQRWNDYANNGHGGNTALKQVVEKNGIEYVEKYFQYSILENFNSRVDDKEVLDRETWWKETLQTRKFGYNGN